MPLTPPDVAAKQFRVAFRGYAIDEVDAFLEEVESELGRLLTSVSTGASASSAAAPSPAGSPSPGGPPPGSPSSAPGAEGQEAALRTLLLAQRTADEAVAEARAEAEQVLAAARKEADATLAAARAEAEATLTASRDEAAGLDAEVAARRQEALGDLQATRQRLEARIEELRAFEREYRTRLRAYVQGQLRELDSRSGPDDDGVGVPVAAGGSAVDRSAVPRAAEDVPPAASPAAR